VKALIFLILIIFTLLALSDFPSLIKKKKWPEVSVLSFLYVFVFVLAVLQSGGAALPSPALGIQTFLADVLKLSYPKQ
jgi:hypothetical protein